MAKLLKRLNLSMLRNMKLRYKLLILNATAIAFIVVLGFFGYRYTDTMSLNSKVMYEDSLLPVKWLNQIKANFKTVESNTLEILLTAGDSGANGDKLKADNDKLIKQNEELFNQYQKANLSEAETGLVDNLSHMLDRYNRARTDSVYLALKGNKKESYDTYVTQVAYLGKQINVLLTELSKFKEQQADKVYENDIQETNAARTNTLILSLAAIILCLAIGLLINTLITRPIHSLQSQMEKAAAGDLTARGNYASRDEVGRLTNAFNSMLDGLRGLVGQINENAMTLAASSQQLLASAEQSSSTAGEIK